MAYLIPEHDEDVLVYADDEDHAMCPRNCMLYKKAKPFMHGGDQPYTKIGIAFIKLLCFVQQDMGVKRPEKESDLLASSPEMTEIQN